MTERPVLAVGCMSGTSLDGMDAALVQLHGPTRVDLLAHVTRPYTDAERQALQAVVSGFPHAVRQVAHLHVHLGLWAADAVEAVLAAAHVRPDALDFVAFPGQTVWHEPPLVSWQIGEPAVLAEQLGVRVVSGFRARDVAAGGEGAPLVPIADVLLFGARDRPRILLNIGGMANVTYVPRRAVADGVIAFDTGPGMALIDALAERLDPSLTCDRDARISRAGQVDPVLLAELLADPFFHRPPPRSTGREHFGGRIASRIAAHAPGPHGVRTAVEFTAWSIVEAITSWLPPAEEVVASGGGTRHPLLWERLSALFAEQSPPRTLRTFDDLYFNGDAKEAVAFALLGYLALHGQPGNLPAVTGARGPRILGSITPG